MKTRAFIYPLIHENGIYRPMIPIRISNPTANKSINAFALIDTGADNCVFPQTIAERTEHNLKGDGVLNYISQGVGEHSVTVYQHTFIIELYAPNKKNIVWRSEQELIGCLDHDNIPPLLGFNDFVAQFKISFNYSTKTLTIEIPY